MAGSPAPPLPRYGTRSLAELVPSLLSSLGLAGLANPLALEPAPRVCLLLVDGLGWELLEANRPAAPFLTASAGQRLCSRFPATTAASLSSLATGLPPGEHGLVGYTMALPGFDRAFNALTWSLYGFGPRVELLDEIEPETMQPLTTLAERAAAAGLPIHHLGPAFHAGSGLTRAIGRGERFHAADSLEAITEMAIRLLGAPHAFVYAYHPRLDTAGHVSGVRSQAWRDELTVVDRAVRLLAEQLPPATLLVVTGDHGMVDLRPSERLDLADHPELASGAVSWKAPPSVVETATLWARTRAIIVDLVVVSVIQAVINGVFGSERITNAIIDPSTTGGYSSYTSTTSVDGFWLWAAAIAYFSLLEGLFGDTLGKAVVGINVTDLMGRPAGWRAVLIRNTLRVIDSFPGFYLVGALVARFSPRRQRIGDHVAGTLVVPARAVVGPGLSAQSRRRRVAVLLAIMIAFAASCFAFAYYGRPPIVLDNIAPVGQFPVGPVANYQSGPAI